MTNTDTVKIKIQNVSKVKKYIGSYFREVLDVILGLRLRELISITTE